MASRSQGSLLSVMPGCTSERVLPNAFSNFAQVGSERKLHIVRSAALIRNLSHTLVVVPADLHITVQVEATEVVFVLGLLAVSIVLLRRHAFGPKKLKRHDLRVLNMFAFLEFGTLPMAEFWYHGR